MSAKHPIVWGGRAIGRMVTFTKATVWRYDDESGQFVSSSELLVGDLDAKGATKKLRRYLDDQTLTVTETETETDYYSIPLAEFLELAMQRKNEEKESDDD